MCLRQLLNVNTNVQRWKARSALCLMSRELRQPFNPWAHRGINFAQDNSWSWLRSCRAKNKPAFIFGFVPPPMDSANICSKNPPGDISFSVFSYCWRFPFSQFLEHCYLQLCPSCYPRLGTQNASPSPEAWCMWDSLISATLRVWGSRPFLGLSTRFPLVAMDSCSLRKCCFLLFIFRCNFLLHFPRYSAVSVSQTWE